MKKENEKSGNGNRRKKKRRGREKKKVACLARVSVWFWSKQVRGTGLLAFGCGL